MRFGSPVLFSQSALRSNRVAHLSGYFGGDLIRDVQAGVGLGVGLVPAASADIDDDVVGHGQRPLTCPTLGGNSGAQVCSSLLEVAGRSPSGSDQRPCRGCRGTCDRATVTRKVRRGETECFAAALVPPPKGAPPAAGIGRGQQWAVQRSASRVGHVGGVVVHRRGRFFDRHPGDTQRSVDLVGAKQQPLQRVWRDRVDLLRGGGRWPGRRCGLRGWGFGMLPRVVVAGSR
jgi:hypothetical protein